MTTQKFANSLRFRMVLWFCVVVLGLSACQLQQAPQTPNQTPISEQPSPTSTYIPTPYVTSTPHPTYVLPTSLPTPLASVKLNSPQNTFSDTKLSNTQGQVLIQDSLLQVRVSIQTQDATTKKPLNNIRVQFLSSGSNYLIIATDPAGKYSPVVKTGTKVSLQSTPSPARGLFDAPLAQAAPLEQGWEEVFLALFLLDLMGKAEAIKDLVNLFRDLPDLKVWTISYQDWCWTGTQIQEAFNVISTAAIDRLPISGSALIKSEGGIDLGLTLAAILAIGNQHLTEPVGTYFEQHPGPYLIRIYTPLIGLGFLGFVEVVGTCNTITPTPTPTLTPTNIPIENTSPDNNLVKVITSIPIEYPDAIAINPNNHRVYLTSRNGFFYTYHMYTVDANSYRVTTYQIEFDTPWISVNPASDTLYTSYDQGPPYNFSLHAGSDLHLVVQIPNPFGISGPIMSVDAQHGIMYVSGTVNPNKTNSPAWGRVYEATHTSDIGYVFDTQGTYICTMAVNPSTQHLYVSLYKRGLSVFQGKDLLLDKKDSNSDCYRSFAVNENKNRVYASSNNGQNWEIVIYDDNTLKESGRYKSWPYTQIDYNQSNNHLYALEANTLHVLNGDTLQELSKVTIVSATLTQMAVDPNNNKVWLVDTGQQKVHVMQDLVPNSGR
jgi:hypothetical protein